MAVGLKLDSAVQDQLIVKELQMAVGLKLDWAAHDQLIVKELQMAVGLKLDSAFLGSQKIMAVTFILSYKGIIAKQLALLVIEPG
jgi:hypothetical protein